MKWFKHLSNSANDNLIFEAVEKFGGDGYMVFFVVMEILADELDIYNPGICKISIKKLRKNCQISRKKLTKILHFFDEKSRKNVHLEIGFIVEFNTDHIIVRCKKFKKLCDDYTRKKLATIEAEKSEQSPDTRRTPVTETETEAEADKSNITGGGQKNGRAGLYFKDKIMGGYAHEIIKRCEKVDLLNCENDKSFNVWVCVQEKINKNAHPMALIEMLDMLIARWPDVVSPWPYSGSIFELKNGNYWESEHIKQANKFKSFWQTSDQIQNLISGIGSENSDNEKICF